MNGCNRAAALIANESRTDHVGILAAWIAEDGPGAGMASPQDHLATHKALEELARKFEQLRAAFRKRRNGEPPVNF